MDAAAPSALTNPPPDLTAAAPPASKETAAAPPPLAALPADKNAPDLSSAPPPLAPFAENLTGKDAGKMVVASNDAPLLPTPAPLAPEVPRAELPSLPAAASDTPPAPAPREMAQATLTPITLPPAASAPAAPPPAPAAALPPAAPAATPEAAVPHVTAPAPAAPLLPAAATPPASAASPASTPDLRIPFVESETDVPLGYTDQLDALAKSLVGNPAERVTIMAYASGPETSGIYPKRVSLARGIAVRNYLTSNKGIDIERVNVKALGNKDAGSGPGDRVDLFILK